MKNARQVSNTLQVIARTLQDMKNEEKTQLKARN